MVEIKWGGMQLRAGFSTSSCLLLLSPPLAFDVLMPVFPTWDKFDSQAESTEERPWRSCSNMAIVLSGHPWQFWNPLQDFCFWDETVLSTESEKCCFVSLIIRITNEILTLFSHSALQMVIRSNYKCMRLPDVICQGCFWKTWCQFSIGH